MIDPITFDTTGRVFGIRTRIRFSLVSKPLAFSAVDTHHLKARKRLTFKIHRLTFIRESGVPADSKKPTFPTVGKIVHLRFFR